MPTPEFDKGLGRIAVESVSSPSFSSGEVTVTVSDLVQVNQLVAVDFDAAAGLIGTPLVDSYSIDGNAITLNMEDGEGNDAVDADVDELIVTAKGF